MQDGEESVWDGLGASCRYAYVRLIRALQQLRSKWNWTTEICVLDSLDSSSLDWAPSWFKLLTDLQNWFIVCMSSIIAVIAFVSLPLPSLGTVWVSFFTSSVLGYYIGKDNSARLQGHLGWLGINLILPLFIGWVADKNLRFEKDSTPFSAANSASQKPFENWIHNIIIVVNAKMLIGDPLNCRPLGLDSSSNLLICVVLTISSGPGGHDSDCEMSSVICWNKCST